MHKYTFYGFVLGGNAAFCFVLLFLKDTPNTLSLLICAIHWLKNLLVTLIASQDCNLSKHTTYRPSFTLLWYRMKCQRDKEFFLWVVHRSLCAERSFLRTVSCCQLYSTITRRTRQLGNRLQLLCKRPCHFGQELRYPPDRNITGHGGALVESIAFNRRVVGSTPALAAM